MGMGDKIKQQRLKLGYTQEELAQKLGLQKSAIAKYENGRVENIKRSVIVKMAKILECTPAYLLDLEEEPEQEEGYYINDDAKELAQFLFENPDYKVLFDASRKVKREDLEIVKQLIDRFS